DRGDLSAQILAQRFPVAARPLLGRAVVAVEEITRALEVLENAQVIVARLPGVRDEEADRVGLRHGGSPATWRPKSRTRARVAQLAASHVARRGGIAAIARRCRPRHRTACRRAIESGLCDARNLGADFPARCDCSSTTYATPPVRARHSICRYRVPAICAATARCLPALPSFCGPSIPISSA